VKLWSLVRQSYPASQSPRAPRSRALVPDLLLSAGRRERPGMPACCQGAWADCDADWEGSDPSSRGFRPSQRSQASPRPPAPRALGCARAISRRCRRRAMASNVMGAPCSVVSSHRIFRNCGGGFTGSNQSGTAAGRDGQDLRPRLAAAPFHPGGPDRGPDVVSDGPVGDHEPRPKLYRLLARHQLPTCSRPGEREACVDMEALGGLRQSFEPRKRTPAPPGP
jgi:hypothetical protein